jgi:hypothetical protein
LQVKEAERGQRRDDASMALWDLGVGVAAGDLLAADDT